MSIGPDKDYLKLIEAAFPYQDTIGTCNINAGAAHQVCFKSNSDGSVFSQSGVGYGQAQTGSWSWTPWFTKAKASKITEVGIPRTVYQRAGDVIDGIGDYTLPDGSSFSVDNVLPQPINVGPGDSYAPAGSTVTTDMHTAGAPWCMQGPYGDTGNWCTTNMQFVPQTSCDPTATPVTSLDTDASTGKAVCGGAAEGDPVCIPAGVGLEPVPMACFKDLSTNSYWSLEAAIPKVSTRFCGVDSTTNAPQATRWDSVRQACVCLNGEYPQTSAGAYLQGPAAYNSCSKPAKYSATAPPVWGGIDDIDPPIGTQLVRKSNISVESLTNPSPNLGMCYLMDPTKTLYLAVDRFVPSGDGTHEIPVMKMLPGRPDALWLISLVNTSGDSAVTIQTVIGTKIYYLDYDNTAGLGVYTTPRSMVKTVLQGHLQFSHYGWLQYNNGDKTISTGGGPPMTPGYTSVVIEKIQPKKTSVTTMDDKTAVASLCGAGSSVCDLDNPGFWTSSVWTTPTDLLQKTVMEGTQPTTVALQPVLPSAATHPATSFLLSAMTGRMDQAKAFSRNNKSALPQGSSTRLDGWLERPGYIPTQKVFGQPGSSLGFNMYGKGDVATGKTLYLIAVQHPVKRMYYMLALTESEAAANNPDVKVTYNPTPFFGNPALSLNGTWEFSYDPNLPIADPFCYVVYEGIGVQPKNLVSISFPTLHNQAKPSSYPLTCAKDPYGSNPLAGVTLKAYANPLGGSGGIPLITKPWVYTTPETSLIQYSGDATSYSDPIGAAGKFWTYQQQTNNAWTGSYTSTPAATSTVLPIEYTTALAVCESSCGSSSPYKSAGGLPLPGVGLGNAASSYTCPPCPPQANLTLTIKTQGGDADNFLQFVSFGIVDGGVQLGYPSDGSNPVSSILQMPLAKGNNVGAVVKGYVQSKRFALVIKFDMMLQADSNPNYLINAELLKDDGVPNKTPIYFQGHNDLGGTQLYNIGFVQTGAGAGSTQMSENTVAAQSMDGSASNTLSKYAPVINNANAGTTPVYSNINTSMPDDLMLGYYLAVVNYLIKP